MARIKGIDVILIDKIKKSIDPFGMDITRDKEILVKNVLVTPISSQDLITSLNLSGDKEVYMLAIPKGDKNVWEDREVLFFGKKWRVSGIPKVGIEKLIPLDWNKQVVVERYE